MLNETTPPDYIEINKNLWNERVKYHLASEFYDVAGFISGKTSLNNIELDLLGNVTGKSILHLQCHFGQDTISLAKAGAEVTGVDFSEKAIDAAQKLAAEAGINATFICCNVYDLPQFLEKQFDIVFASYGVIGWLHDMKAWAEIVNSFIKPGGTFVFVEFHPVVWMFDNDFKNIQYSYFNNETISEEENGTYAEQEAPIKLNSLSWNHDLSEVLQNLLDAGLSLKSFCEYDYSPYNCFSNMVTFAPGKYMINGLEGKIPMVYALKMVQ